MISANEILLFRNGKSENVRVPQFCFQLLKDANVRHDAKFIGTGASVSYLQLANAHSEIACAIAGDGPSYKIAYTVHVCI